MSAEGSGSYGGARLTFSRWGDGVWAAALPPSSIACARRAARPRPKLSVIGTGPGRLDILCSFDGMFWHFIPAVDFIDQKKLDSVEDFACAFTNVSICKERWHTNDLGVSALPGRRWLATKSGGHARWLGIACAPTTREAAASSTSEQLFESDDAFLASTYSLRRFQPTLFDVRQTPGRGRQFALEKEGA